MKPVSAENCQAISFHLNGRSLSVAVDAEARLVEVLRDHIEETGTKVGCSIGRCGACTVLIDGLASNACLAFAWQVAGREVITIEGVAMLSAATEVQAGLLEESAFQCGYCAPGFVMALTGFLSRNPQADDDEVIAALEGNICRCTGYASIVRGALNAAARVRGASAP
ncbi:MAG: (2Fe-2S)-binding protein [Pseudomonadota bacterium]